MQLRRPEYDSLFAWAAIIAAAVLLLTSCQTSRPAGPNIIADQYVAELYQAYNDAYKMLSEAGAPVRHFGGDIRVSFKTCSYSSHLGYGDRGNGRYALTIGNVTEMCLAPDGSFQPAVARGELAHYLLFRNESEDYPWMRKAGLLP